MAFLEIGLPAPAGNASGVAVDATGFGALKTITVQANTAIPTLRPFVTIEISNDAGGLKWAPLTTFQGAGQITLEVACRWMRATVSNYRGGGSPVVTVGGENDGTSVLSIPVPAGNGVGSAVDVSALPLFKTPQVGGPFRGALVVEISEDGGATFQQAWSFGQPGSQNGLIAADFIRVSRNGVPQVDPGTPVLNIAATTPVGGGGGGGTGVTVEQDGVAIPNNPKSTLNFKRSLLATDAGGAVADIELGNIIETPAAGYTFINLVGTNNDVDLWSGGPITSIVEVDIVGATNTIITGIDSSRLDPNENVFVWLWSGGNGGTGSPDTLTIKNQDAASLPANRIWTPNGKDLILPNNAGILLIWAGTSWFTWSGSVSMVRAQELSLDPSTTPAALADATTYNDYDPFTGTSVTSNVKQDVAANGLATITGIVAAGAPNSEGRLLVFQNISTSGLIKFKNQNGGSIADNRIICPFGLDITIGPRGCLTLIYDDTVAMYRVQAAVGATSGGVSDRQVFRVSQQGGDTDTIVINAGRGLNARASVNYNVQGTMGVNSLGVGIAGCDPASFTTTQFTLKLTSAWAAGDSIMFTVEDLT